MFHPPSQGPWEQWNVPWVSQGSLRNTPLMLSMLPEIVHSCLALVLKVLTGWISWGPHHDIRYSSEPVRVDPFLLAGNFSQQQLPGRKELRIYVRMTLTLQVLLTKETPNLLCGRKPWWWLQQVVVGLSKPSWRLTLSVLRQSVEIEIKCLQDRKREVSKNWRKSQILVQTCLANPPLKFIQSDKKAWTLWARFSVRINTKENEGRTIARTLEKDKPVCGAGSLTRAELGNSLSFLLCYRCPVVKNNDLQQHESKTKPASAQHDSLTQSIHYNSKIEPGAGAPCML